MSLEINLKRRRRFYLSIILLTALALRLYGISWGLPNQWHPYSYHPDEARLFSYMANIHPGTLDFNPDDFAYPTFHVLVVGAILLALSKLGIATITPSLAYYASHPHDFAMLFLVGRLVTVAMAVVSVYLVYLIGQQLYNQRAGLWAAFLFAIAPVHVVESHYFTLDVPMAFWMLLTLLFSIYVYRYRHTIWYIASGISLGLAASTKYPGAAAVVFIVAAHALAAKKADEPWLAALKDSRLWMAAVVAVASFAAGTPYSVLEPGRFSADLMRTHSISADVFDKDTIGYNQVLSGWGSGPLKLPYVYTFLVVLPFIVGWVWYLFFLCSAAVLIKKAKRRWPIQLLFSFAVLYALYVGRWLIQGQRYYIPLLPIIAIATAAGFEMIRLTKDGGWHRLAWVVLIMYTLAFTISLDYKFNDTIDDGFQWAYDHIPEGKTVAATLWAPLRYSPLSDPEAINGAGLNTKRIIALRHNNITADDRVPTTVCNDPQKKHCKTFNVVTMVNPSDEWLKKYDPDWIILSSLEYIGDNPPPKFFDLNVSNGRDFYKGIRKSCAYPQYQLVHVLDRPYFTEGLYTSLEPRYKSYFPSPRLEFYRKNI